MKIVAIIFILLFLLAGVAWVNVGNQPKPLKFIVPAGWPQPKYDFKKIR